MQGRAFSSGSKPSSSFLNNLSSFFTSSPKPEQPKQANAEEIVSQTLSELQQLSEFITAKSANLIASFDSIRNTLKNCEVIKNRCLAPSFLNPDIQEVLSSRKQEYEKNHLIYEETRKRENIVSNECGAIILATEEAHTTLEKLKTLVIAHHNAALSTATTEEAKTELRNKTESLLQKIIQADQEIAEHARPLAEAFFAFKHMYDFHVVHLPKAPTLDPKMNLKGYDYNAFIPLIIQNGQHFWVYGLNKIGIHTLMPLTNKLLTSNKLPCGNIGDKPKRMTASTDYVDLYEEIFRNDGHIIALRRNPVQAVAASASSSTSATSSYVYSDESNPFEEEADDSISLEAVVEREESKRIAIRHKAIMNIAASVDEIHKLSIQTRALIFMQGEKLETIAHNILTANEKISKGDKHLTDAHEDFQRSRKITNKILIGLGVTILALTAVGAAKWAK